MITLYPRPILTDDAVVRPLREPHRYLHDSPSSKNDMYRTLWRMVRATEPCTVGQLIGYAAIWWPTHQDPRALVHAGLRSRRSFEVR